MSLRRSIPVAVSLMLGFVLSACGSSAAVRQTGATTSGERTRAVSRVHVAEVMVARSAPGYCRTLINSSSIVELGAAMKRLAQSPDDPATHAALRNAATALVAAASNASGSSRAALLKVAVALHRLDREGLRTASGFNSALQRAANILEGSCGFPVG